MSKFYIQVNLNYNFNNYEAKTEEEAVNNIKELFLREHKINIKDEEIFIDLQREESKVVENV